MLILGFTGGLDRAGEPELRIEAEFRHDAGAVLLRDGAIVSAVEEERLERGKHSDHFPFRAMTACLELAGIGLEDVDYIAIDGSEDEWQEIAERRFVINASWPAPPTARGLLTYLFHKSYGIDIAEKLRFCDHHDSHLFSAYGASGFDEALVMSFDGEGYGSSARTALADYGHLRTLRNVTTQHSVGFLYLFVTSLLGYTLFDEYKVMGLAPYGNPDTYSDLVSECYRLLPEGGYEMVLSRGQRFERFGAAGLVAGRRRRGEPFTQQHKDLAAAIQRHTEAIVLHALAHFRKATGRTRLCLGGGVMHNSSLNGKILYSGLFDEVFIQPAAGDGGNALGAAYSVHFATGGSAPPPLSHVFLGRETPADGALQGRLDQWRELITFEHCSAIAARAAQLLDDGAVIGWMQGRSELGPRALGNRSILADPRPAANKDRINAMVKKRESYRPFAPAVQAERVAELFRVPEARADLSFMTYVLEVLPEARAKLGAVTHVDGSARLQTVSREVHPRFWELLEEFRKRTGLPVLLNTSFNNHAEPIVDSLEDALACFLTTGLTHLIVGDHLIEKRPYRSELLLPLLVRLAPGLRLVRRPLPLGKEESVAWNVECATTPARPWSHSISAETFRVLSSCDGRRSLASLIEATDISSRQAVLVEIERLWNERMVQLSPYPIDPA